ncbi:membrane protein of unknown function [Hyphomicrobium sp. 1Nfss2.1]|uniref:hypothetical protein n=1 Tax=Hyphomicrobium sp. 1Nfss2.1 TaxID=3413936 RepID=UPI003C7DB687
MTDLRKVARYVGYTLTVISCGMSAWFGWQQSPYFLVAIGMALFLGAISIMSDYIWPLVTHQQQEVGSRWAPSVIAGIVFALFCNVFNLASNFGSVGFTRGMSSQAAEMQNVRHDDGRKNIADLESKKAILEGRMSKLEATEGWTGMKPSAAYDGDIEAQKLAVEVESKRGGCKARCLAEKQKLAELEGNKAVALAHEQDRAMLAATIEALAKLRMEEATVEKGANGALWQNASFASLFTASLEPTETAKQWTERWVAWGLAFMLAFGGMGANYYGHWGRGSGTRPSQPDPLKTPIASAPYSTADAQVSALRDMVEKMQRRPVAPVSSPSTHTKELMVVKEDDPRAKQAYDALSQLVEEARQLKAA